MGDNTQLTNELLKAAQDVSQAINNLLNVANVNSSPECDSAIDQITKAANSLDLKRIQSGKTSSTNDKTTDQNKSRKNDAMRPKMMNPTLRETIKENESSLSQMNRFPITKRLL
jgi:hypothetical protein